MPELPESAINVMGGQVGIADKLGLLVLSNSMTCFPPGQAGEMGLTAVLRLVAEGRLRRVPSLNMRPLLPMHLSSVAVV